MTTIFVKNADFSGGRLAHYAPPVAGAALCAFVGDSDDSVWLRNFGSGADLAIGAGSPSIVDQAFRRFGTLNFLNSDAYRTPQLTMLAVYRSITPVSNYSSILSSEREAGDGGRRGCVLNRNNTTDAAYVGAFGTSSSGASQGSFSNLSAAVGPSFVAGTIENITTGARSQAFRKTSPSQDGPIINGTLLNQQPAADEASYPLRVGHSYRSYVLSDIDIGFVAVYPRVLSAAEISQMYSSVRKRFAALGVSI